jgi:hypothetical protein
MYLLKSHPVKLLAAFILLFSIQSCNQTPKPGFWRNEQIPAGKREDFHELNKTVLADMKIDDEKHLAGSLAADLIDNLPVRHLIQQISTRLQYNDYTMLDEYYVVNKWKKVDTIINKNTGVNNYNLYYEPYAQEMYFAFLVPKTGYSNYMITLIYAKLSYGWKLANLSLGPYSVNNKNAAQFYGLALKASKEQHFSNAETFMELAHACQRPSFVWRYTADSLMTTFYHQSIDDANHQFSLPVVVSDAQIKTQPRVFDIVNQKTDNGTYPMVYYQTVVKLSDINGLKKENEALRKVIGKIIPGIDKDNDCVLFEAYNKMPNRAVSVDRYRMAWRLK